MKISFIIPIYNEEKTLVTLLEKVKKTNLGTTAKEVILINDYSTDSTREILDRLADEPDYIILHNEKNLGKSQSVKKGVLHSTGDIVVVQDADLEYNPVDLIPFVSLFLENKVDLVYGNRFGMKNEIVYWQNWMGNTILSIVSSFFTFVRSGIFTRDMEVCYKMARGDVFREVAKSIQSKSGFGFEPEITARFSRYKLNGKRLRYRQIPISYKPRRIDEGKHLNAYKDGVRAMIEVFRYNFFPR